MANDPAPDVPKRTLWQHRVLDPVVAQLTQGITPEKIALTIAVGSALALFPMLGVTTLFCLLVGIVLRLNQPMIQVVNYLCTPIHLPLIFYFWHLGEKLFGVPHVRMRMRESAELMWNLLWSSPGIFLNGFGLLVFHAAVVWAILAPFWTAAVYYIARTTLREVARVRALATARAAAAKLADPGITRAMTAANLALTALALLCPAFAVLYLVARRIDNYGIVDIAWSYAFSALATLYALLAPGWPVRRALIAAMAVLWSARLGTHLFIRVMGHHPVEDGRYVQLRQDWAANFAARMFGFFQLQAVSVVLLAAAFLLAALNPAPVLHGTEIGGLALWLLAISGETRADRELAAFKRDPANKGRVCDVGLWRYSRHPNYFFEWLIWVAYFVFALASPWGWLAIIGPASILYLLLRVTGIPMTEEQSLRSRGDAYRRYQQTTSAFVPWFPRKPAA